ncbi:ultraviolet-B receptor UVR8-like isoform X2 [Vicia villosa]|uniref:ultraviolet-B receptor UVR8-like isoform X2 n=1 Tax=Vicia villosa TaxID=3911 RepID=UPI00273AE522|nr:ultraviolet-B receptor UVR8-like isoform X2 [Vicia villosa]
MWHRLSSSKLKFSTWGLGLGFLKRSFSAESGKRFAALWGNGDYGRLGLGDLNSQWTPAICTSFHDQNVKAIACGGAHTLFLTDNGCVYATGLNDFGQLGISESKQYSVVPLQVFDHEKKVVQISAGYNHSSAVTVDGELYMWGKNTAGQLGLGKRAPNIVPLPTKVEYLDGITIKMTALGSEHSVAISDGGEAFSWGMGVSGRLGHGHESSILGFFKSNSEYTPRLIKDLEGIKVKNVAAGMLTSACTDENGSVYIFGEKGVDKLLLKEMSNATKPSLIRELPYAEEVACGGYHTCVLTSPHMLFICLKRFKGHFWSLLSFRFLVVGSIQQPFLGEESSHGVGEVLMELSLMMDILQVDNWVMEVMWIV